MMVKSPIVEGYRSLYKAKKQPSTGQITVVRTSWNKHDNTFTFNNSVELRVALSPFFEHLGIEVILQELDGSGSADFVIST
jgi:hypothetical protein